MQWSLSLKQLQSNLGAEQARRLEHIRELLTSRQDLLKVSALSAAQVEQVLWENYDDIIRDVGQILRGIEANRFLAGLIKATSNTLERSRLRNFAIIYLMLFLLDIDDSDSRLRLKSVVEGLDNSPVNFQPILLTLRTISQQLLEENMELSEEESNYIDLLDAFTTLFIEEI